MPCLSLHLVWGCCLPWSEIYLPGANGPLSREVVMGVLFLDDTSMLVLPGARHVSHKRGHDW